MQSFIICRNDSHCLNCANVCLSDKQFSLHLLSNRVIRKKREEWKRKKISEDSKSKSEAADRVAVGTEATTDNEVLGAKYSKLFHIISKIDSDNDIFGDPSFFFFTLILAQFYCW